MNYTISDQPEIEVEQTWLPTGEGIEAEVACNIHAEPVPEVSFFPFFFLLPLHFFLLSCLAAFRFLLETIKM